VSLLAGCGSASSASSASASASSSSGYPVTVDTYSVSGDGAAWTPITATYDSEPQRVVANNQGTAQLLIRLGLADKLVGVAAVYGTAPDDVKEAFDKIPVIAQGYASKEAVQGVNPDFVTGRGDLFIDGDYGIGTVDELKDAGISSYITHVGYTGATFTSFLEDIDNYGKIFNVQDKAEDLKEYYQSYTDDLKKKYGDKDIKLAEVSYINDGSPVFGSASTESLQNEALEMVGMHNINASATGSEVSIETVIAENPQVIILFDYAGGPDMDEMIQSLYDNPQLADIDAIRNHQVYSTDFSQVYGGSGDLYSVVSDLAQKVYGE
jgi:iron complex transport system substrate-binding protein